MFIGAGIDFDNYDRTFEIINAQLEDIRNGIISDKELDASKRSIITALKGIKDQPGQIIDYYLGNVVANTDQSIDDFIDSIEKVDRDEVTRVSHKIKLDTIYFLRNQ